MSNSKKTPLASPLPSAAAAASLVALSLTAMPRTSHAAVVSAQNAPEVTPQIAYSPYSDEFLVVWQSNDWLGGQNIYARRYNGDHTPAGNSFSIATSFANERQPDVAYNPATGGFVVAYVHDGGQGGDIRVAEVSPIGMISLQPFNTAVATDARPESAPKLAYNDPTSAFVLTYELAFSPTDLDVYAVEFDSTTGGVIGSPIAIGATGANERTPDVACAPGEVECLIVYEFESGADGDVLTRLFDAAGNGPGQAWNLSVGSAVPDRAPHVAADDLGEFLVVWERETATLNSDVIGRRVDALGTPMGSDLPIATTAHDERAPDLAYTNFFEYYVVWEGDIVNGLYDIWQRPVTTKSQLRARRRLSGSVNTNDDVAPAVALSDDYPIVGMAVWQQATPGPTIFSPLSIDVHMGAIQQSDAPPNATP